MSRALILRAQARFLNRPLTAEETEKCLKVWAELAAGERVYVPQKTLTKSEQIAAIRELRAGGSSYRAIVEALGVSYSTIAEALQNPALICSTEA